MPFPTEQNHITAAEHQLGVVLPSSLRDFLLLSNGAEIEFQEDYWNLYPVFDDADMRRAKRSASHIVIETKNARSWRGFPENAVAIGSDDSGNQMVLIGLDASRSQRHPVFIWWHETGELQKIADDFADLV
jgi:SMI1 / KNR4 family (SUKH-1)